MSHGWLSFTHRTSGYKKPDRIRYLSLECIRTPWYSTRPSHVAPLAHTYTSTIDCIEPGNICVRLIGLYTYTTHIILTMCMCVWVSRLVCVISLSHGAPHFLLSAVFCTGCGSDLKEISISKKSRVSRKLHNGVPPSANQWIYIQHNDTTIDVRPAGTHEISRCVCVCMYV